MNTKGTQAKMKYLSSLGYTVTTLEDGSKIATHQKAGITILFTDAAMEIRTEKTYYKLQGWKSLDLSPFVMIAVAFRLVPMTEEEKAHSAHMIEHYGVQFLNQLS